VNKLAAARISPAPLEVTAMKHMMTTRTAPALPKYTMATAGKTNPLDASSPLSCRPTERSVGIINRASPLHVTKSNQKPCHGNNDDWRDVNMYHEGILCQLAQLPCHNHGALGLQSSVANQDGTSTSMALLMWVRYIVPCQAQTLLPPSTHNIHSNSEHRAELAEW